MGRRTQARRLLFVGIMLVCILAFIEGVSWVLHWAVEGTRFSASELRRERQAIAADQISGGGADDPRLTNAAL